VCACDLYPQQTQDRVFMRPPDTQVAGVLAPTATSQKADGGRSSRAGGASAGACTPAG
jgi:hypothetical protein